MTPERWKRTDALYHAARTRPPWARAAFLAAACRDDESLRRDVESLLNERVSDGFLAEPALRVAARMVSDVAPPAMIGESVGAYQVQSLLGAGGMGEVYRARDTKLGRDVAIKILSRAFTSSPDRLARFEREARMLASLNHPKICAIYGLEEADGIRFLILELVDGETLAERLVAREREVAEAMPAASAATGLPLREAIAIARQIAEALEAAHEKGIVHRDLKPANIKITPDGVVKVLDFGLAKAVDAEPATPNGDSRDGVIIGTAAYMSPEQARGKDVDKRADIWAFGCVLYEMLTGRVAFAGDTVSDTIGRILEREPDWSLLPAATPAPVRQLLLRCLAKNAQQRLRDIGDIRIEIDEVLPTVESDVTAAPSASPATLRPLSMAASATVPEKIPDQRFQSVQDFAFAPPSAVTSSSTESALGTAVVSFASDGAARSRGERIAWAVVAVLCATTLGLGALAYRHGAPVAAVAPIVRVAVPLPAAVTMSRTITVPAFGRPNPLALSPDGAYLAFVAFAGSTSVLWLRPLDSLIANRLAGTEGAIGPFWSPDSRSIAFFANGKLKRVGVAGGEPQTLCETNGFGGATWNREDVILLAPNVGGEGGLVRVPASGGTLSPVTRLDPAHAETNHVWPHFLPDGRHFLYNIFGRDDAGIYVGSLDSPDRTQLLPFNLKDPDDVGLSTLAYAAPGYLLYVRGRTLVAQPFDVGHFTLSGSAVPIAEGVEKIGPGSAAFSVSNTGVLAYWAGTGVQTSQIIWRARDGTVLGPLGAPGGYTSVELAPDERRIAVSRIDPGKPSAIWVLDVMRGTSMRVSFDPVSLAPVWSPDSASLVFGSAREGPPSLIQKTATDGGQGVVVFKSDRGNIPTDWCEGGRTIVFQTGAPTRSDIWLLPLTEDRPSTGSGRPGSAEGRKPIALLQTPFNERGARCSPDGRWLAFSSDESGRDEVYVTSFPTPSGKWPISTGGGRQPQWRRDGTELFYVAPDNTLTAVRISAGSTFEAKGVTPLFKILGTSYAATADGRRFVTDEPIGEASSPPINIVLNWPSGLKK